MAIYVIFLDLKDRQATLVLNTEMKHGANLFKDLANRIIVEFIQRVRNKMVNLRNIIAPNIWFNSSQKITQARLKHIILEYYL